MKIERIYGNGYLDISDLNQLPIMLTQLICAESAQISGDDLGGEPFGSPPVI